MRRKKIVVMGVPYTVKYFKDSTKVDTDGEDKTLSGQVDFNNREIRIYDDKSEWDTEDTVLHEIMHIVMHQLFRSRTDLDLKTLYDESVFEVFTTTLKDTLERNKLVEWKIL